MKNYVIIVAGGSGSRMKTDIPKQFISIHGLPVLMHTIKAFHQSSIKPEIILVLNESYHLYWKDLCAEHTFDLPLQVIKGGEQRFDSVKNALSLIREESLIAVHDAVRPIVSEELILRSFKQAQINGSSIPVVPSRDSLRKKTGEKTVAINREDILIVQTPQVFKSYILQEAYNQAYSTEFTDDASVVEKSGHMIHTVEGDFKNIKITYPEDLEIASLFLKQLHKKSPA